MTQHVSLEHKRITWPCPIQRLYSLQLSHFQTESFCCCTIEMGFNAVKVLGPHGDTRAFTSGQRGLQQSSSYLRRRCQGSVGAVEIVFPEVINAPVGTPAGRTRRENRKWDEQRMRSEGPRGSSRCPSDSYIWPPPGRGALQQTPESWYWTVSCAVSIQIPFELFSAPVHQPESCFVHGLPVEG